MGNEIRAVFSFLIMIGSFILVSLMGVPFDIGSAREPVAAAEPEVIITLPPDNIKIDSGPGKDGITVVDMLITIIKPLEAISDTVTVDLYYMAEEKDLHISIIP